MSSTTQQDPAPQEPHSNQALEFPDQSYRENLWQTYLRLRESDPEAARLPRWTEGLLTGTDAKVVGRLGERPRLQAALASVTNYTPSKWLLEQERYRYRRSSADDEPDSTEDVYEWADRTELAGLALSGGGIRSATFCLGALQAFAQAKLLPRFDYLSTVSGGSYVHQWLAQWTTNAHGGFADVNRQLIPQPEPGSPSRAPDPIFWLRRYSSYLTPQRGIFSSDTWTLVATWFRNTSLNQLVLFAFLASCIFALRGITVSFFHTSAALQKSLLSTAALWVPIFVFFVLAIFLSRHLSAALRSQGANVENAKPPAGALTSSQVLLFLVAPGFVFAWLLALESSGNLRPLDSWSHPIVLIAWACYVVGLLLFLTRGRLDPPSHTDPPSEDTSSPWATLLLLLAALACASVVIYPAFLLSPVNPKDSHLNTYAVKAADWVNKLDAPTPEAMVKVQASFPHESPSAAIIAVSGVSTQRSPQPHKEVRPGDLLAIFAPVLFFALQFVAFRLQVGILGRDLSEPRREWLARYGALSAMLAAAWLVLSVIAQLGPVLVSWIIHAGIWKISISSAAMLLVHVGTLYAGGSAHSDGQPDPSRLLGYKALDLFGIIGAPVCILSLLMLTAAGVDCMLSHGNVVALSSSVGSVAVLLFFGWRIDVNDFSLHGFYRNRLARCYLGASNAARTPDPFTGFDDHIEANASTGLAVSDLLPARFGGPRHSKTNRPVYDGPFPIFCSTLNLTFGEDLAWQERKGASFAVTPLYTGYDIAWTAEAGTNSNTTYNGYVPTRDYAYRDGGIRLAEAAAISGAALSPNQGFTTQPTLAFLMTIFNVRVGQWIANTRKPRVWPSSNNTPTPRFGLSYLLSELFGWANDTSKFVCLADGGRFENMGMYELVRRRCKLIVVCDCEQDKDYAFEGIGKAIAKCRTDFGVEINLDLDKIRPAVDGPRKGLSEEYVVEGDICYPAVHHGQAPYKGKLIYIKATVTGHETADIVHYKQINPAFPQQSTLNQWFTESQFESYRRLGQISGKAAVGVISSKNEPSLDNNNS